MARRGGQWWVVMCDSAARRVLRRVAGRPVVDPGRGRSVAGTKSRRGSTTRCARPCPATRTHTALARTTARCTARVRCPSPSLTCSPAHHAASARSSRRRSSPTPTTSTTPAPSRHQDPPWRRLRPRRLLGSPHTFSPSISITFAPARRARAHPQSLPLTPSLSHSHSLTLAPRCASARPLAVLAFSCVL